MKDIFLMLLFNNWKNYINFIIVYNFYMKEWRLNTVEKFVANLHDKFEYVIHIRNLKQELNHRLDLKKVYKVN